MNIKILFLLCLPIFLFSQTDESQIPIPSDESRPIVNSQSVSIFSVVQVIIILAIMVFALIGVFYLIKKRSNPIFNLEEGNFIKVIDFTNIAQNKSLYLVKVGSELLLLSSSDNDISLISKIIDDDLYQDILQNYSNKSFAERLGQKHHASDPLSFLKKQGDKLKKM